ncbi:hypothetical protein IGK74_002480 [Enterococcus sp. AZ150]|uniref:DUF916 and DUF3324 domain-containing protein n=1 Tax=Enterococcus sp. AZ150 TaxID=2774866 RepID=UPI003F255335
MKIRNFVYTLGLTLIFFASSTFVQASEFNFAVNPIIPENQINKKSSYFDLKLAQNQKETLKVQLKNDTDKEIIIEADINSATTNLNGVVEYSKNTIEPDESLTYNLKDYTSIEPEIKLPAKTTIEVPINVSMPDKLFDGVMAGGITFKEKQTEEKTNSEEKGLAIKNEYSYVVALLIRQNEQPVESKLNLLDVGPSQVNARNVINIQLQNPVARYINQLKLVGEIIKKDNPKVKYTVDVEGLQMAPNSNFSYPVVLNGQKLEPGNYHLHLLAYGNKNDKGSFSVKSKDGVALKFSNQWEFDKDFSISGEVAEKYNKQDVTIEKEDNNDWLYWIIGLLLLIIALMILFLIWKRKKKKDDETK